MIQKKETKKLGINRRFKEVREKRGLTQKEVADMLKVSRNTILNYEHEINNIPWNILYKCPKIFDVSLDYLIYGKECLYDYELLSSSQKEIINELILEFNEKKL